MRLTLGNTTGVFGQLCKAYKDGARHIWVEGGTAASKTYSILQFLTLVAHSAQKPLLISIVSESMPHLKRGCIRDFKNIMGESFDKKRFNQSDFIYQFDVANVEFFSADDSARLRGARRDILFGNEFNNVPYDAFRELDSRTRLLTICDWNPVSEFWYHMNDLGQEDNSVYIHATYRDAMNVNSPEIVKNILKMGARDPNWANVYLEGKIGKIEGLVYPFFEQIPELPNRGVEVYGLDWGYATDPTVLTRNQITPDELYSHQLIYEAGLTNDAIARRMIEIGVKPKYSLIYADNSEPKSIDELRKYGFNVKACPKGPDSVEFGHQKIRQYKQYWTKSSLECIKEQRNFRYIPDKDGKLTERTTHTWSHGMDSRRYAVVGATGPGEVMECVVVYDSMQLVRGV